jgi:hypothetical protein
MEKVLLSTKLERLMTKTKRARENLAHGKYSNGVYSRGSGDWAQIEMENLEKELLAMMKDAIRVEAVADTIANLEIRVC